MLIKSFGFPANQEITMIEQGGSNVSKSKQNAPLLFIDTVGKGCFVKGQHIFKTPETTPKDILKTDYAHHYDKKTASDLNKWTETVEES